MTKHLIKYLRSILAHSALVFGVFSLALLITDNQGQQIVAQALAPEISPVGTWEGPLYQGQDSLTLAFTITQSGEEYSAVLISSAMGIYGMPADSVSFSGLNVTIKLERINAEFSGTLRLDDTGSKYIRIDGDWFQYSELVTVVLEPVEQASF